MSKKIDLNLTTFLILIIFTILVYLIDQNLSEDSGLRNFIILFSTIKFSLIYFVFMGMLGAHKFWKLLGASLLLLQVIFMFL